MNVNQMLQELQSERERIQQAINALQALDGGSGVSQGGRRRGRPPGSRQKAVSGNDVVNGRRKQRTMSKEARAKIAAAQKARWAKQKAGK